MGRILFLIGVICLIGFSCARLLAPPPKIDLPHKANDRFFDPTIYCEITSFRDDPTICSFVVFFPDGTVLSSFRSFSLKNNKNYLSEFGDDIYKKYKGLGWGRYLVIGDTLLSSEHAEFINMGGALHYDLYKSKFRVVNMDTLIYLKADSNNLKYDNRIYVRIDSVDVSSLNPARAWINSIR